MLEARTHYCSRCKQHTPMLEWQYVPDLEANGHWKHVECGWMEKIPRKVV